MLRNSCCGIALMAMLTTFIAVIGHSQSMPTPMDRMQPQEASESPSNATVPVCYIQLENGQLRDLRRLCGKKPLRPVPSRTVQQSGVKPEPAQDNNGATTSSPKPVTTPPQPSPTSTPTPQAAPAKPVPLPTTSPLPSAPVRPPVNGSPSPIAPSISPSDSPNPLAIPDDDSG